MLNPQYYEPLLIEYIKQKFSEFNPKQQLMFGLDINELAKSLAEKVLKIPVHIEYDDTANPHGIFQVDEKTGELSITIGGIDNKKYDKNQRYNDYVDSVLWHELIHAVNYIMKPWNEIGYDAFSPKPDEYYSDPHEQEAFKAQIKFLSPIYNRRKRLLDTMNANSSDKSPKREEWMKYLYENACPSCNRESYRRKRTKKMSGNRRKIVTAGAGASVLKNYISDGRNETYNDLIADSDRYLTDAYYIIATLRETVDGFSVACHINAGQLGTTSFASYWHYNQKEYKQAKKTFNDIKKTCINIRKNIEFERLPFALIMPMFRHETRKIDTEHMEVPKIPHIMYNLDSVQEKDWRHTLYGDRYPTEKPPILNYEIDHSVDERSRYVTTTPGLGRDKLYKYKYEDPTTKTAGLNKTASLKDLTYTDIGHKDANSLLWKYDNHTKKIIILREQVLGEVVRPHAGDDFEGDRFQIAGRVDIDKKIGSCDFGFIPNKTALQMDVMNKLINAFPDVKFLVFKSFRDQHSYPNPESLQSYYERIAGKIAKSKRLKYTKTADYNLDLSDKPKINKRKKYQQAKPQLFFQHPNALTAIAENDRKNEKINIDSYKSRIEEAAIRNPAPFKEWFQGSDRVYIPLQTESQDQFDKDVAEVLEEVGCVITDYRGGYCKQGNRIYKIAKAIELARKKAIEEIKKNPELYYDIEREIADVSHSYDSILNTFINSEYRRSKREVTHYVVISQNPYDIATMSTNRGWTSCMQLGKGAHYRDVFCEIAEGGLVAYLVREKDRDIKNPLARISIKRFVNKDGQSVAIQESTIYGNSLPGFAETVRKWITSKQGNIQPGMYERQGGDWSDTFNRDMLVSPTSPEDVLKWYKGEDPDAKSSKFIFTDLLQEWLDDEYDQEVEEGSTKVFKTREEAEQYASRITEFEDEMRESHGDKWIEKDPETGEWAYPLYSITERTKDLRTTMKREATKMILDSPKGTYPDELIKQIKIDLFDSIIAASGETATLQQKFIDKYPELVTSEDIKNALHKNDLYRYIDKLPEGPQKNYYISELWSESEKWLDNFGLEEWAEKDKDLKDRMRALRYTALPADRHFALDSLGLRMSILWTEALAPLDLMKFIPENIIQKIANVVPKILDMDIFKEGKQNGIIRRSGDYRIDMVSDIVSVFNRKRADTPTVQKLYASLLPYYGENHRFKFCAPDQKNWDGTTPSRAIDSFSRLNIETLGQAIGNLGINGQQFLPWAEEKLAEEQKFAQFLLKEYGHRQAAQTVYKHWVKKNIERYQWIVDNLKNQGKPQKKYRFYKFKNNLTKTSQQYTEWLDGIKPCRILYHPDVTGPYKLIELSDGSRMEVSVRRIKRNPIQNKSKVEPIKDIYCPNCGGMSSKLDKCESCEQELY